MHKPTQHALTLAVLFLFLLTVARPVQAQTETVLYNFTGSPDGQNPASSLTSYNGSFYGTTEFGGLGYGTVFQLSPNGSGGWNESILYRFTGGADGRYPINSNVIFDSVGNLYGTASEGGRSSCSYGCGVVFELSPVSTHWTESVLYSFCGGCGDGENPGGGLIMDPEGNLYGSTFAYPGSGVFELSPSGGGWTEQLIYDQPSDSGLTMDAAGNIFGTTDSSVFELSPNGSGWKSAELHYFPGIDRLGEAGAYVNGPVVFDRAGNLYGTTMAGRGTPYGTVFELSPRKNAWKKKILYTFHLGRMGSRDGLTPLAGVVFDAAGNIYGTTAGGGEYGHGTVYELVAGTGSYTEKVLWSFNGPDGSGPLDSLILDSAGNLYGTTIVGGSTWDPPNNAGYGIVFEVIP
jgi:uncharacterized repeat protein (TIGR03803 family)